jgi:hypothetical protein
VSALTSTVVTFAAAKLPRSQYGSRFDVDTRRGSPNSSGDDVLKPSNSCHRDGSKRRQRVGGSDSGVNATYTPVADDADAFK